MALNVTHERRKALGVCIICERVLSVQDRASYIRCAACRQVHAKWMQRRLADRHKPVPRVTYQPAPLRCLRCERVFQSWDKRHNRLCEPCKRSVEFQDVAC